MQVKEAQMKKKPSCGVLVGRFQVDELHPGHKKLIQSVVDKHSQVIIFLGLSPLKVTRNNPLDYVSRKKMINEEFPEVTVLYIKDVADDVLWSKRLDEMIRDHVSPTVDVTLYGSRESFIDYYHGKFKTSEVEQEVFVSGTEIRNHIGVDTKGSKDFRSGVIYAVYHQYPKMYPTVDVAVFNEDESKLLLAKKPGEKLYRFIGGFVDGESLEAAARREVDEEAHIEITDPEYVGSFVVDDWRYRRELDKILTTLFRAKLVFGKPTPDDDVAELRWFEFDSLKEDDIVEEHRPLLAKLK
jgi:bifunctional NMN adenylyltransferase/nudix hydrolase